MFVFMPAKKTGHMRKLACPFHGPYCVVEVYPNGLDVRLVDKPGSPLIRVAMQRVRHCPLQILDDGRPSETSEEEDSEDSPPTLSDEANAEIGKIDPRTDKEQPGDGSDGDSVAPAPVAIPDVTVRGWKGRLRPRH